MTDVSSRAMPRRWIVLVLALLFLDASLTFHNLWPTPVVTWWGELSLELAICLTGMALAARLTAPPSRTAVAWLSAVWVVFVLGRYADVTAPALYGRDVNLYWDSRYVSAVVQMLFRVASVRVIALVVAGVVLVPLSIFGLVRWAFRQVAGAMRIPRARDAMGLLSAAAIALFVLQAFERLPISVFAQPVTRTYWHQASLFAGELTNRNARRIGPSPSFDADLARVQGADVLLFFLESYGATSFDRPEFVSALAPGRATLEAAIRATGREVVSAFVESPTFGGNSWLAHVSFLSGVEVRDEDTNMQLMSQRRDSLASAFRSRGYKTVAVMPGLHQAWPEGEFYGFSEIYDETRLDYRGPPFGWWTVPDQFTIARLDALELAKHPRAPVFAFYPTVGTHTPFSPTAPYQPDWPRVLTDAPFDEADLQKVWVEYTDWLDFGPSYARALSSTFVSVAGYLRFRADRDFVLILIGDHQPPAVVTGENARWDVPVHVITSRKAIIEALLHHGFRPGLTPQGKSLMHMHALTPVLLGAFSGAASN